jgi:hypothetical protein
MGKRVSDLEASNRAIKARPMMVPDRKPSIEKLTQAIQNQVATEMKKVH